ncbi:MAG TPA: DUF4350 domain-containing protein [Chloroflexota bacterium]|nr:DUF4350 domain-containing protein [Chloroflexota bacterium]
MPEPAATPPQPAAATPPPPPPPAEDEPGVEEYADSSAFYRFSAFLGLAAAILFAVAVVLYSTTGAFDRNIAGLMIVAVVLAVLYAIPRLPELGAWLRTRTARQGGNVTLASVAFIGLLAVGNWVANRHSPQWDLTAARRYTLSDQTVKVLDQLQQDVQVTAFFPSNQDDSFVRGTKDLLRQYARRSPRFKLEFIDPELSPGTARQYEITQYPITIFQSGDRREETTGYTEQDFTSALLKLTRREQKKVYFVQGHQERDPDLAQESGYTSVAEALKRENYLVEKLSLLASPTVPEDAAVVVIAGPRTAFLDAERQALDEYLNRGGHVLLLLDPRQDAALGELLSRWYVQVGDDFLIDTGRSLPGDPLTILPLPQSGHRIASSLPDVVLPGARSVSIASGAGSDVIIAPLLRTTERSWAETTFDPNTPARHDPGQDLQGPVSVAVAVHRADPQAAAIPGAPTPTPGTNPAPPKGRLVVIGNSEFASNRFFTQLNVPGNRDLFVNSVNWLAEDENLISIRATPNLDPTIVLNNQSQVLIFYTSVVFIPLAVLLMGGLIWWQRR